MAYRLEKEPNGEYAIVIDGWENGIAPDPYSGINRMSSVNLNVPGEVSVGYPLTASTTSGATLGVPIARSTCYFTNYQTAIPAAGEPTRFAILDNNGRVWESTSVSGTFTFLSNGNSNTGASSLEGVAYWCGFLLKTRGSSSIYFWNGTTWAEVAGAPTLSSGVKHFMYVGDDNVLYITNGDYLASIELDDPSDPNGLDLTNTGTFTFNATTLQVGITDQTLSICEVGSGGTAGSTLLIGGSNNLIYPWDKISETFDKPIVVAEPYIFNMVSANQNAFIFTGGGSYGTSLAGRGRIYITNGSQAEEWFKMPDYAFGVNEPYYVWGDAIFHRNKLIFGCMIKNNSNTTLLFAQLWAIDFTTKAFSSLSDLATGTAKGLARTLISGDPDVGAGMNIIVGIDDDSSTPSIAYSGTASGTGTALINTDLIPIGTFLQKKTFTQVEFKLRTALAASESVSMLAVVDGTSQSNLSFQPTVTTGSISGVANVNFQGAQWLQMQATLTGASTTSGCRLKEIRIR